jgi:predicted type IV restriction endonuclease
MTTMPQETDARIIIDRLLREADWDVEDKSQVSTEEAAADGRADYLLKDSRTRPLAVLEAKWATRLFIHRLYAPASSHLDTAINNAGGF